MCCISMNLSWKPLKTNSKLLSNFELLAENQKIFKLLVTKLGLGKEVGKSFQQAF